MKTNNKAFTFTEVLICIGIFITVIFGLALTGALTYVLYHFLSKVW